MAVLWLLVATLMPFFEAAPSLLRKVVLFSTCWPITVALAMLSFRHLEAPLMDWGRRIDPFTPRQVVQPQKYDPTK
jgi:peptidoglycan/LPS O-acetylase OafA/YrhL